MGSSLRGSTQLTPCPGNDGAPGACGTAGLTEAPPVPSSREGQAHAGPLAASPSSLRLPFTPALSPGHSSTLFLSHDFFQILSIYLEKSQPPLFIQLRNRWSFMGLIIRRGVPGRQRKATDLHPRSGRAELPRDSELGRPWKSTDISTKWSALPYLPLIVRFSQVLVIE